MSMNRLKWLVVIVGVELVVVTSLLLWAVFTPSSEDEAKHSHITQMLNAPKVTPVLVAKGLGVPTAITGSGKTNDAQLFVADRHGVIHIIDNGTPSATAFLDISSKVKDDREMGLLGLAFHPQFTTNGYFYVNYVD